MSDFRQHDKNDLSYKFLCVNILKNSVCGVVMLNKYLECGQIVGTHGIKGEMRVNPWCDGADFLLEFKKFYHGDEKTELEVLSSRVHGNILLIKVAGVDSIEQAEKLRGTVIYIDRDDVSLEEGRYFISDLLGCAAVSPDGYEYGKICDISSYSANDVLHIKDKDGKIHLMPNVPQMVKKVDVQNGKIVIEPIKGIFDDED